MNHEALEGATFRKARGCADKNCVEVAAAGGIIGVRDSTSGPLGLVLAFAPDRWSAFLGIAKEGQFDLR